MKYIKHIILLVLFIFLSSNSYSSFLSELIDALSCSDYEKFQQLIDIYIQQHQIDRDHDHWSMLQLASYNSFPEIINLLVVVGCVNVNGAYLGYSPLELASINGDIKTIKTLCSHGANPVQQSSSGSLAIHACAQHNNVEAVNYLISQAPDTINSECHAGYTPLSSIFRNHEDGINTQLPVIYFLLSHGASPDSIMPCQNNKTILHDSVSRNLYSVVIALIINDVNLSPLNHNNQTPFQVMEHCPDQNSGMLSILGPAISAETSGSIPDKGRLPRSAFSLQNWTAYWIRKYFNHFQILQSQLPSFLICFVLYNSYETDKDL